MNGLGNHNAVIRVYIANKPAYADFSSLNEIRALREGEIAAIGKACGNGWRKVFNVYAKFLFALKFSECASFPDWQTYRDSTLLQSHSNTSLLFSPPALEMPSVAVSILMGRTYAKQLLKEHPKFSGLELTWLNEEFAVDRAHKIIVCPYFDYRQLSNIKIIQLVDLVRPMLPSDLLSIGE